MGWSGSRLPAGSHAGRPHVGLVWLAVLLFLALSFAVVLLLSVVAAATARLAIDTTVRFYCKSLLSSRCSLFRRALHEASVMNILAMLWNNLRGGSRTMLFPSAPR